MTESAYIVDVDETNFNDLVVEGSRRVPVMVDFWADWCGPCKNLTPVLEKLTEAYAGGILLAKIDTDRQQRLAAHFGVRSLPTVLIVRDGQIVDQFTGVRSEAQVRAILEPHAGPVPEADGGSGGVAAAMTAFSEGDLDTARATLERLQQADPEDLEARVALARVCAAQGDWEVAQRLLDAIPAERMEDAEVRGAKAELQFARRLADAPAPAMELERRLQRDDGDSEAAYFLALHQLARGEREQGLAALFALMRRDRGYGEDLARKTLLEAFDLLGAEDPLVRDYRRRLFTLMY